MDDLAFACTLPDLGEAFEELKKEAQRLADMLGDEAAAEAAEYPDGEQALFLYLKSFGIDHEKMREIMQAIEQLILYGENGEPSMQAAFEELRKLAVDLRHKEAAGRSRKPPRRVPSPALSPPQRKYWINYKPRNRLPVNGQKKKTDRRAET